MASEAWRVMAGDCPYPYAERPTREEAEAVVERDRRLIEKFGTPIRVEQSVFVFNRAK